MKDEVIILRTTKELKEAFAKYADNHGTDVSKLLNACMQHLVERCQFLPIYLRPYIGRLNSNNHGILSIGEIQKLLQEVIRVNNLEGKIKRVYLFGSYSRGEANADSDIDIRVECQDNFGMRDLGALSDTLNLLTKKEIDVVTKDPNELDSTFYNEIRKEEICLYDNT